MRSLFLLCVLFCGGSLLLKAQDLPSDSLSTDSLQPIPNSLLWEINRDDLKQASYLYGTIHLIPKDSFFLTASVEDKLSSSQRLVLEIPLKMDLVSMFSSALWMLIPKGKSLSDYVSQQDYELVKTFMSDSMPAPIPLYHRIKPIFVAQQISSMYCGGEEMESYEMVFSKKFQQLKRPVSGLESMKDQMKVLDEIPIEEQAESLMETIRFPREACAQMEEMVNIYRRQDLQALMEMTQSSEDLGDHLEELLDNRNERWIPQIEEMVAKEQVFIAVGAGHLAGPKGVIQLLRSAGYTVSPIMDVNKLEE